MIIIATTMITVRMNNNIELLLYFFTKYPITYPIMIEEKKATNPKNNISFASYPPEHKTWKNETNPIVTIVNEAVAVALIGGIPISNQIGFKITAPPIPRMPPRFPAKNAPIASFLTMCLSFLGPYF